MTFPSLPTDNLYKFLAISGVVMLVASSYLTSTSMQQMQEMKAKERREMVDRGEERIWRAVDGVRLDHPEKEERTRELHSMEGMMRKRLELETEALTKRLNEIESETYTFINMLGIMEKIGFLLAPLGFALWWWKVQRLQDAILWAQYQKELVDQKLKK